MRKLKLFIATSLDGFIARTNGEIDWLFTDGDYGYHDFVRTIDTVIMGGNTYRQVLSFGGDWPYADKQSIVFTHDVSMQSDEDIAFIHHDIDAHVRRLKESEGKDLWLVGGAQINTILMKAGLIDELWIFKMPVVLGSGIPLFHELPADRWYEIHDIEEFDTGLVKMIYYKKVNV